MKKKLLAISMAAALGMGAGAASAFEVTSNGIGHYNVLPYFSVQGGNISLIHVTNTDTANGKAVKVRFRSAEWSDDVLDFQLFLSPGDVWTGYLSQEGENTVLRTNDNTCSLPANLDGVAAPTFRLVTPAGEAVEDPARTREGYVELITMADIPYVEVDAEGLPTKGDANSDLANAIKHVDGVADCGTVVSNLQRQYGNDVEQGFVEPTASIASFATVLNVEDVKAFTVAGTAIESTGEPPVVMYFRQANARETVNTAAEVTADSIFRDSVSDGLELDLYQFDLPDLTTPVAGPSTGAPEAQRDAIAGVLRNILNGSAIVEYVTDENVLATTEVVLNQPLRRFFYDYTEAANGDYTISSASGFDGRFDIGIDALYAPALSANSIAVGAARFYDREEGTHTNPTDIVISPTPPSQDLIFSIAGEVSVISINGDEIQEGEGTGSLGARLTAQNYDTSLANPDGWGTLSLTAGSTVLPVIGFNAINLYNAGVNGGSNYSITLPLRGAAPAAP